MPEQNWTKEPWNALDDRPNDKLAGFVVMDSMGFMVADCNIFGPGHNEENDRNRANHRRIVACVNALAGVADPEAFMKAVQRLTDVAIAGDSTQGELHQAAEVLAALKETP